MAVAIIGYVFLIGAQQGFNTNPTGVNAVITASLYSSDARVGVYGDMGNFTISLSNSVNLVQRGGINITNNGRNVQGSLFVLLPSQTVTVTIAQQLNSTGIWTVKVTTHGIKISSYSFQVVPSKDEADYVIEQSRAQTFNKNVAFGSIVVALASIIVAIGSLARKPTTVIRSS